MYIKDDLLYTASVGDPKVLLVSNRPGLTYQRKKRKAEPSVTSEFALPDQMESAQVTVDQFITNKQEIKNFHDTSILRRFKDSFGNEIGPYRLCLPNTRFPGLKVARAIGDFGLSQYGLSHTAIVHTIRLHSRDQFIVMATDGVWEVMSNAEVAGFVEKFRHSCKLVKDNEDDIDEKGKADTKNSTVCRLLCEEARKRWFDVTRQYDVESDDIACVMVEFGRMVQNAEERSIPLLQPSEASVDFESRRIIKSEQVGSVKGSRNMKCPAFFDGRRRSIMLLRHRTEVEEKNESSRGVSVLSQHDTSSLTLHRKSVKRNFSQLQASIANQRSSGMKIERGQTETSIQPSELQA